MGCDFKFVIISKENFQEEKEREAWDWCSQFEDEGTESQLSSSVSRDNGYISEGTYSIGELISKLRDLTSILNTSIDEPLDDEPLEYHESASEAFGRQEDRQDRVEIFEALRVYAELAKEMGFGPEKVVCVVYS